MVTKRDRSEYRPLPIRVTQLMFERLQRVRKRDGLAVQEHIRRAVDEYLVKMERIQHAAEKAVADAPHMEPGAAAAAQVRFENGVLVEDDGDDQVIIVVDETEALSPKTRTRRAQPTVRSR